MDAVSKYRLEIPQTKRIINSTNLKNRYPDRIPIIIDRKNDNIPYIIKNKFLVPSDITFSEFIYLIKKKIKVDFSKSIFIFTYDSNILPQSSLFMNDIYINCKNDDGFLYLTYSLENTFG